MKSQEKNFEILGISENATLDEIKKAYNLKAKICHPDKGGNSSDFIELKKARDELVASYKEKLVSVVVNLTLEECFQGVTKNIYGKNIEFPPGIREGAKLQYGLMVVVVKEIPHKKFTRSKNDLFIPINIPILNSLVGTKITIVDIKKEKYEITLPPLLKQNQLIKIPNLGMPAGDKRGNLILKINLETPTTLPAHIANAIINLTQSDNLTF